MKRLIIILFGCVFLFCGITHADVTEGLIAHYPFEGNADDISGYDNHGDEFGGITYVAGEVGQSALFDGVDDYFTFPQTFPFHEPTDVSMTFWLNAENQQEAQAIFWTGPYSDINRFHILTNSSLGDFEVDYRCPNCSGGGNYRSLFGYSPLRFNEWVHMAMVRSGNIYSFYVDGSLYHTPAHG